MGREGGGRLLVWHEVNKASREQIYTGCSKPGEAMCSDFILRLMKAFELILQGRDMSLLLILKDHSWYLNDNEEKETQGKYLRGYSRQEKIVA